MVNPIIFNNQNKEEMVLWLKKLFEDKNIEIPDDSFLINSIHQIQREKTKTGHLRFDAEESKETGHADAFWALAQAALGFKEKEEVAFEVLEF